MKKDTRRIFIHPMGRVGNYYSYHTRHVDILKKDICKLFSFLNLIFFQKEVIDLTNMNAEFIFNNNEKIIQIK